MQRRMETRKGDNTGIVAITPTGSPFTYTNSSNRFMEEVWVMGGTVSKIEIVRLGTAMDTELTAGAFLLNPGDSLITTYSGTPTMKAMPR